MKLNIDFRDERSSVTLTIRFIKFRGSMLFISSCSKRTCFVNCEGWARPLYRNIELLKMPQIPKSHLEISTRHWIPSPQYLQILTNSLTCDLKQSIYFGPVLHDVWKFGNTFYNQHDAFKKGRYERRRQIFLKNNIILVGYYRLRLITIPGRPIFINYNTLFQRKKVSDLWIV